MVFNVLQFESKDAELAYWRNLAEQRGQDLESVRGKFNEALDLVQQAKTYYNATSTVISNLETKYATLKEGIDQLADRVDKLEQRADERDRAKRSGYRQLQRTVGKLENDVAKINDTLKLLEKKK